jgi:hypothetical protein
MNAQYCQQLDDYLLRDLSPLDRVAFEGHLTDCAACRLIVEQEQRINGLLKAASEAIPCPPGLAARIRRERDLQRGRQMAGMLSILAASLVIGLLGWSIVSHIAGEPKSPPQDKIAEQPMPDLQVVQSSEPITNQPVISRNESPPLVRVEFPDEVLSLPIDSGEPDITLIQLFPVSKIAGSPP